MTEYITRRIDQHNRRVLALVIYFRFPDSAYPLPMIIVPDNIPDTTTVQSIVQYCTFSKCYDKKLAIQIIRSALNSTLSYRPQNGCYCIAGKSV